MGVTLLAANLTWLESLALPNWAALAAVITGSLVGAEFAAQRGFDPVGVFGLAFAQGLGGLMLLELLLLNGTPQFLSDPSYLVGTTLASIAGFFFAGLLSRSRRILTMLDALAMGCLVCVGVEAGLTLQLPLISVTFLGTLAATGGIVLRDVLSGNAPTLLRPGVLIGIAALIGALFYVGVAHFTDWPTGVEQILTVLLVFTLRLLAARRGWRTQPSIDLSDRLWEKLGGSDAEVG